MVEQITDNFNWVKGRAECSISAVFKSLEMGAKDDVKEMEGLLGPSHGVRFSVVVGHRQFSVMREESATALAPIPVTRDVNFIIDGQEIIVSKDNQVSLRATITLNNEGQCKMKVGTDELDQWQVRRMALEQLFFGPFDKSPRVRQGMTVMGGV